MITEPVGKDFREAYVAADQDLYWLAEHGALPEAAEILRSLRAQLSKRETA